MALNQYAKTERDFTSLLNSANMSPADRDKLSAILASLVNTQTLVPGVEQQITDIETEIGDIVTAINNIKVPVWKMQVFDANGTFTVPDAIAGNVVYVTGSGGGGSGAAYAAANTSATATGANSGCFVQRIPYSVSFGDLIAVQIGLGGESVSTNTSTNVFTKGNKGGDSYFGSLVIPGGAGGDVLAYRGDRSGGWVGMVGSNGFAQNSISHKCGQVAVAGVGDAIGAFSSAAGAFGNASNSAAAFEANATAPSAPANSGAGGGSAAVGKNPATPGPYIATSGAGGSGKIIIEWQEFV